MSTEVCVGNLPTSATEAALALKFIEVGIVLSVRLEGAANSAKASRRTFVEMQTPSQAQRAIHGLNRADYAGGSFPPPEPCPLLDSASLNTGR